MEIRVRIPFPLSSLPFGPVEFLDRPFFHRLVVAIELREHLRVHLPRDVARQYLSGRLVRPGDGVGPSPFLPDLPGLPVEETRQEDLAPKPALGVGMGQETPAGADLGNQFDGPLDAGGVISRTRSA